MLYCIIFCWYVPLSYFGYWAQASQGQLHRAELGLESSFIRPYHSGKAVWNLTRDPFKEDSKRAPAQVPSFFQGLGFLGLSRQELASCDNSRSREAKAVHAQRL